jgi:F-type H+-transporting ATPase subunit b
MQDLDIISVNIWHIVISLANLVILFLILKKLLFKPVKKIVDKRQKEIESEYKKAEKTQAEADAI